MRSVKAQDAQCGTTGPGFAFSRNNEKLMAMPHATKHVCMCHLSLRAEHGIRSFYTPLAANAQA
eukprot:scaffold58945_cov37-Tisochrysis_lutea.AAC.2